MNTKADILSRKDWVDTREDNKNIQMLKEGSWTRTTAEIMMLRRNKMIEDSDLLKEI